MDAVIIPIKESDIVLNKLAMGPWCKLPYPNHPKGCPNFNKKKSCPPNSKFFKALVEPPYFLVIQPFDIGAHIRNMKERHPEWSERQCRNLLYWQKGVVKRLKEKAEIFMKYRNEDLMLLEVPEANGVDLFKTCEKVNIFLERNPKNIVRKIMIIGKRKF